METAITKKKGIDSLVSGYTPGKVEEKKEMTVRGENNFHQLYGSFEEFISGPCSLFADQLSDELNRSLSYQILSPSEINTFLSGMIQFENLPFYKMHAAFFISKLIQDSYEAGNNDFTIDATILSEMSHLGSHLKGKEDAPLRTTIRGDGLRYLGANSRYTKIRYEGNADLGFGASAENCKFILQGDAGSYFALNASDSIFTINGSIIDVATPHHCTFKTDNKETLERLKEIIPVHNKIIYIDKEGEHNIR